ncbi:PepSY domain-containing protein [Mycobacterium sp. HUMS_1102779]|uniref:PepSY domain-containing protein n=1 Tax=Mycobacterium sp. HUMS_1102779 TaxID=3383487 RepID=UPI00389A8AFB
MPAAKRRTWILTAFLLLAIAALAGCGHSGKPATTPGNSTSAGSHWSRPSAPPDPQTLLQAGAVAVTKVPGGTLTSIRTQETGSWRVHVVTADGTEQSMDVSSDGVTILVGPTPMNRSDADKAQNRALVQAATVNYRTAVEKFLATVPNGSITEMQLAETNGATVWEADVWDTYIVEHKVTLNAASGDVIANKQV